MHMWDHVGFICRTVVVRLSFLPRSRITGQLRGLFLTAHRRGRPSCQCRRILVINADAIASLAAFTGGRLTRACKNTLYFHGMLR